MSVRCRVSMLAGLAAVVVLAFAAQSNAAFRGKNGRIAAESGGRIYTFARDGSARRLIGSGRGPVWSPDGTKLAYVSEDSIVVADADGSHAIDASQPHTEESHVANPVWSPDGRTILFTRRPHLLTLLSDAKGVYSIDGAGDIYRANADGSGEQRMTADSGNDEYSWSSDGASIVYTHLHDGSDDPDIYRMSASGGSVEKLTDTRWDWSAGDSFAQPMWSPASNTIVYWSNSDGRNNESGYGRIFTMDPGGSNEQRLTSGAADAAPQWSPDGTKIAYLHGEHTASGTDWEYADGALAVMKANGADQTRLADAYVGEPTVRLQHYDGEHGGWVRPNFRDYTWSPDSTSVLWPDDDAINSINVATGAVTRTHLSFWFQKRRSTLSDGVGSRAMDFQALPANSGPPSCQDLRRTVRSGSSIRIPLVCSDPHGRPLTLEIPQPSSSVNQDTYSSNLRHGTLSPIVNGAVTYTPYSGYSGPDGFLYQAHNDLDEHSNIAAVTIDVRQGPRICRTCGPR